jgi:hypothetical protein
MRLLAACTLGAAVAAAAFAKPYDRIAVTLQTVVPPGANVSQLALERSAAIMPSRLARLGVDGTITHPNGSRRIVLHLYSSSRPAALEQAKIISQPGRLELYDLEASLLAPSIDGNQNPVPSTSMHSLLEGADKRGTGRASAAYLFSSKAKHIVAGPVFGPASRDQLAKALVAPSASSVVCLDGCKPSHDCVLGRPRVFRHAASLRPCPARFSPPIHERTFGRNH